MNRTRFAISLIGLLAASLLTSSASAMYDPGLGRFLSRDPLGFEGGSSSHYLFLSGETVNRIDAIGTRDEYIGATHDTPRPDGYPPYPVGNPNAGPILWPEAVDNWPVNDFENGNEKCSCKSLQGNRMRPTSPATGKAPPVAGLPWADCKIGESVMVRYQSSCEPDKDLPCKEPCEASVCWEYVCYKCKPRRVTPNSKFPEITTQWSKCDDDRGDTKKSKCSL